MDERFWLIEDHEQAPDGYLALMDEEEGGVILYVVAHLAESTLALFKASA